MQSPKITVNDVGAAFELRTYGSSSSNSYLLLQVFQAQEDRYRFFAGKSINDTLHKVPVTFSKANTCHIPVQNTLTQFHVRPIEDIKSLFPPEPNAQTEAATTNNPPEVNGSTVVDNSTLLPKVDAHPGKHQPLTPEDSPPPHEFGHTIIKDHPYAIP